MLKRPNRLTSNFEFNITRKYGNRVNGKYFQLFYLKPRNYEGPAKFGIVVSSKLDKKAVTRNHLKRLYRNAIRVQLESYKDNYWFIIQPNLDAKNKTYEEISTDFNQTIQKISFAD